MMGRLPACPRPDVKSCQLVYRGIVENDPCPGGADIHYWYLYRTVDFGGAIELDSEGSSWKWFSMSSVDLDKVIYPLKFFLTNNKIRSKILS